MNPHSWDRLTLRCYSSREALPETEDPRAIPTRPTRCPRKAGGSPPGSMMLVGERKWGSTHRTSWSRFIARWIIPPRVRGAHAHSAVGVADFGLEWVVPAFLPGPFRLARLRA